MNDRQLRITFSRDPEWSFFQNLRPLWPGLSGSVASCTAPCPLRRAEPSICRTLGWWPDALCPLLRLARLRLGGRNPRGCAATFIATLSLEVTATVLSERLGQEASAAAECGIDRLSPLDGGSSPE